MASSSPSFYPSSPVFSSKPWSYDVFLSFRGKDTRKTLVDHLYIALVQQGIHVFMDDELIGPSLMKVIEESLVAVIIFSENYINSSWCLDELAHIMKCKDERGQIVLPIFYGVNPSALRKQKWTYNEVFARHELENKARVESWKKALVDASQIAGYEVANGHEARGIKEIVDTVSEWTFKLPAPNVYENLIGVEARLQDLKSKLQIDSGGVLMIGIWGIGGGGKTTLASSIYVEFSSKYDSCCFVNNIREESSTNGYKKLQERLLENILKQKQVQEVRSVEEGRHMIKARLCHKKVLIVLDDVDQLDQLQALAGSHDWFGEGSRILITTRDEHLLIAHRVDVIHKIRLLNHDEAVNLFCKHAFQGYRLMKDYETLVEEVILYASGLPLALVVLGSFLCDKDIIEWRSALARLREIPNKDIIGMLRINFDGLNKVEKDLFLDIACFFRGENKDRAMEILDACGFRPLIGVEVLRQKGLITISDGKFNMHKLVQTMAHYIVKGEHPKNPEKHTRVWKNEDVQRLSAMDATMELDMVEAIRFKCNKADTLRGLPPIVANMENLRLFDWEGDISSPLPTNFPPRKLCCLKLDGFLQKQLWEGDKYLPHLKIMELCGMRNLITTPNFEELPNLERFKLTGSWYLEAIHPSIGKLKRLKSLSIKNCFSLKMFPLIHELPRLNTVTFSRCPKLCNNRFGDTEVKKPQVYHTDVEQFLEKPNIPHNNMNWFRLPYENLRELDFSYCDLGDEEMAAAGLEITELRKLDLTGNKFSQLNFSFLKLPKLKWLNISYCKRLVELSELPSSIAVIIADDCTSLQTFGDVLKCEWLWNVSHRRGNKLGDCGLLIHSMLQGKALEDHFISVSLEHHNPEGFVGRLSSGTTFTLHLPDDWYNDFCGFLICIVTDLKYPDVNILIKEEEDEDSRFEHWQEESDEAPEYDGTTTSVGYVSFKKLVGNVFLKTLYNTISFSIGGEEKYQSSLVCENYVGAELVSKRNKGDQGQTTTTSSSTTTTATTTTTTKDSLEFCEDVNPFTIQQNSMSSINILWKPYNKRS